MQEFRLIHLEVLPENENLSVPRMSARDQTGRMEPTSVNAPAVALDELKQRTGELYIPQYLPSGFEMWESDAWVDAWAEHEPGWHVHFLYKRSDKESDPFIGIEQFGRPGKLTLREGYFFSVSVNAYPTLYIEGGWMVELDDSGLGPPHAHWAVGHNHTIIFERATSWSQISIWVLDADDLDVKSELHKIAESLVSY